MKKYLFNIFVLVLATMVGCQKSEVEGVLEESNNSANKITVTADIANDGQTRVALTPDTDGEGKPIVKVNWRTSGVKEKFDVFSLLESSTPTIFEQIEGNQFSGNNIFNDDEMYVATYPSGVYSHTSTLIYDKSIFTSQNGQLSEDKTLMLAYPSTLNENTKFSFIHSTALLMPKFRVQGATVNLSPAEIQTITLKSMPIDGGTADFNIDCTGHGAEDDIYVYLPTYNYEIVGIDEIEVVVTTRDAKIYDGEINIGGTTLYAGKLYTANIWLTQKVFTNVITYITTDNSKLTFGKYDGLQESMFESHTYESGIGKIVLKNDVTSIPNYGLTSKSKLKSLVLPSVVTRLGEAALSSNQSLTSIDITYITEIDIQAFASCSNLSQITMPQSEFTIGDNAFVHCGPSVIDLSNATSIGHYAFNTNVNLTTVIVNRNTPATVGMRVFNICNALQSIYVPDVAVSAYQSTWPDYENKIKAISEMP